MPIITCEVAHPAINIPLRMATASVDNRRTDNPSVPRLEDGMAFIPFSPGHEGHDDDILLINAPTGRKFVSAFTYDAATLG